MLFSGMAMALIGCATVSPDNELITGPPRYESLAKKLQPRIVSFRANAEDKWHKGLWLGTEGQGKNAVAVIHLVQQQDLPTQSDWQEYRKILDVYDGYATVGTPSLALVRIPLSDILDNKLLGVPFRSGRIIAAALNHRQHMADIGLSQKTIENFKNDPPRFFWKNTEPVGPFDAITIPTKNTKTAFRYNVAYVDYEVEIGLVIGKKIARGDIRANTNLSDVLAGIVLANDVSDREPQIWAISNRAEVDEGTAHWPLTGVSSRWTRKTFDLFTEGKSHPTFAVLGPFLVNPADYRMLYTRALELWRHNGSKNDHPFALKQNGLVMDYLHDPLKLIQAALEDPYLNIKELNPGDVILMGTPAGTILKGSDLQKLLPKNAIYPLYFAASLSIPYLKPGDEIWAESDLLGFQRNKIK